MGTLEERPRAIADAHAVLRDGLTAENEQRWGKYRVFLVDGRPYPYHLAISDAWKVHCRDAPDRNAYKYEYVPRIVAALDDLLGRVSGR